MLSHQIIQQPKNLLTHVTRVIVRGGLMYYASPRLFFVAMAVPIPSTLFLSWAGVKLVRHLNRKIHHVNEVAAAGSINVLKEMVTVRQFAMEVRKTAEPQGKVGFLGLKQCLSLQRRTPSPSATATETG